MLVSPNARSNGPAFLAGCVFGLIGAGIIVMVASTAGAVDSNDAALTISSLVKLLLSLPLSVVSPKNLTLIVGAIDAWKVWLLANNAALTAVLLLVFGFSLLGKGIGGVFD